MSEVIHFWLKPGQHQAFRLAQARIHDAIGKTSWSENYFLYQLWNGGGPHFVLVIPRASWAAMTGPELPFPAMLAKAHGQDEATQILSVIDQGTVTQTSEVLIYRPDLSYVAKQ
jgi:hypothetical protein